MLLENIKLSELPSIYLLDKDKLPNCACIYFISDSKGQILYIGRTVNLVERWREHHRFNQLQRGEYATESEVIRDGLRTLQARDVALEK